MYTRESYQSQMLWNEGFVLQHAAQHGMTAGAGVARATIDGCINGMIRIEGAAAATEFMLSATDRVSMKARGATPVAEIGGVPIFGVDFGKEPGRSVQHVVGPKEPAPASAVGRWDRIADVLTLSPSVVPIAMFAVFLLGFCFGRGG